MAFYVQQSLSDFNFKAGFAENYRVLDRMRDHETRGGPQRRIGVAHDWQQEEEARFFRDLTEFRLHGPERKHPYEILVFDPKVVRHLKSRFLATLGFTLENNPIDPNKEDLIDWLDRVAALRRKSFVGRAARHNLDTEARLRALVNPEHRGGWTLAENCSGNRGWAKRHTELSGKQQDFLETLGFEKSIFNEGEHLVCVVHAKGLLFKYFVFAEVQDRMGIKRHDKALVAGFPWRKPKTPGTPRAPLSVKRAPREPVNPAQLPLWGTSA